MDNLNNGYDFMLFDFGGDWAVTDVDIGWRREYTNMSTPELDVFYWSGNTDPQMASSNLTDDGWELLGQFAVSENNFGDDVEVQSSAQVQDSTAYSSQYWLVAPSTCGAMGRVSSPCASERNDAFKLASLTGDTLPTTPPPGGGNEVPEPASLLLLGGALPFLRRKWMRKS
jgi:hypothetical protein